MAKRYFIDLFAGCGGLSRGLLDAGFHRLLAVEKSDMAGETYFKNLLGKHDESKWQRHLSLSLDQQIKEGLAVDAAEKVLESDGLRKLLKTKKITLLAGGPPCQGYSTAGKRDPNDPRNRLPEVFLKYVERLRPQFVLVENVPGMRTLARHGKGISNFWRLANEIMALGYLVQPVELDAAAYHVPQMRKRSFLICQAVTTGSSGGIRGFLRVESVASENKSYSAKRDRETVWKEACANPLIPDPSEKMIAAGDVLRKLDKKRTREKTTLKNHEIRRHSEKTIDRFALYHFLQENNISRKILALITQDQKAVKDVLRQMPDKGRSLKKKKLKLSSGEPIDFETPQEVVNWLGKKENIRRFGTLKHSQRVILRERPSPTVLTIPDDLIHPTENRTLTVREMAALQGFEDNFVFYGKVTTGGSSRAVEVPQYSQVGNAVPPPLARAIGEVLKSSKKR